MPFSMLQKPEALLLVHEERVLFSRKVQGVCTVLNCTVLFAGFIKVCLVYLNYKATKVTVERLARGPRKQVLYSVSKTIPCDY